MSSSLSSDTLNELLPVLNGIVNLISENITPDRDDLDTLLLGAGFENNPAALEEVERWVRLLTQLRDKPTVAHSKIIRETLLMRGLPEAQVSLAVRQIIKIYGHSAPAPIPKLKVNVESLDFGIIYPGQVSVQEFDVEGGPGSIEVDGDQIRVSPSNFDFGKTRVRVEICSQQIGTIWTNLRLITNEEIVEISIIAQCQVFQHGNHSPSHAVIQSSNLIDNSNNRNNIQVIKQDILSGDESVGDDDFDDLERVVKTATPKQSIKLRGKTYYLSRPLEIGQPITLVGEGIEKTKIVCGSEKYVLRYFGDEIFCANDIAFIHEGNKWADVVRVDSGEVLFHRCEFTGGIWDQTKNRGGNGLWLQGIVNGIVEECLMRKNAVGIRVSGEAKPDLQSNRCEKNQDCGIAYHDNSGGTAKNNTCSENEGDGISLTDQASPILDSNECVMNNGSGIAYYGSTGGVAKNNFCAGNGHFGIYVGGQARPSIERNKCQENDYSGIGYFGSASGVAQCNLCNVNKKQGFCIGEKAQPTLDGNTCQENRECGILYLDNAGGVAQNNTCINNELDGIAVRDKAKPRLEKNTSKENKAKDLNIKTGLLNFLRK